MLGQETFGVLKENEEKRLLSYQAREDKMKVEEKCPAFLSLSLCLSN